MDDFTEVFVYLVIVGIALLLIVFYIRTSQSLESDENATYIQIENIETVAKNGETLISVETINGRYFTCPYECVQKDFNSPYDYVIVYEKLGLSDAKICFCYYSYKTYITPYFEEAVENS